MQAVLRGRLKETLEGSTDLTAGATVRLRGRLQQSKGRGQSIEFVAEEGEVVGKCDIKVSPDKHKSGSETYGSISIR